jgi:hypothetical protein
MTDRDPMQQALATREEKIVINTKVNSEAIPEQISEPVAWQWLNTAHLRLRLPKDAEPGAWNPLYTAPPRREWVGLTDREIEEIARYQDEHGSGPWHLAFARAIEAKLKEKNAWKT